MANPANSGNLIGRLLSDPKVFKNSDGSRTVYVTLAVEDDYKSGPNREVVTNEIPVQDFVPVNGVANTPWRQIGEGDLIGLSTRLSAKRYTDRNGNLVYGTDNLRVEVDGFPKFLESRATTQARRERKAAQGQQAPAAEQAPAQPAQAPAQPAQAQPATGESAFNDEPVF